MDPVGWVMTKKVLKFKVSNMLEEDGLLDIIDGKVASPEVVANNREARKAKDKRDRRESDPNNPIYDDFTIYSNIAPVTDWTASDKLRIAVRIVEILSKEPLHCSELERRILASSASRWGGLIGHFEETREIIKHLIDKGIIQIDGSLRLQPACEFNEEQQNRFFSHFLFEAARKNDV